MGVVVIDATVAIVEEAILRYCVVSIVTVDVVAVLVEKAIVDEVGKWSRLSAHNQ